MKTMYYSPPISNGAALPNHKCITYPTPHWYSHIPNNPTTIVTAILAPAMYVAAIGKPTYSTKTPPLNGPKNALSRERIGEDEKRSIKRQHRGNERIKTK